MAAAHVSVSESVACLSLKLSEKGQGFGLCVRHPGHCRSPVGLPGEVVRRSTQPEEDVGETAFTFGFPSNARVA
eukprot:s3627_g6.t1